MACGEADLSESDDLSLRRSRRLRAGLRLQLWLSGRREGDLREEGERQDSGKTLELGFGR